MNTDPIADMLTRIRNANIAKHSDVQIPVSNLKLELAKLLKSEGYIENFEVIEGEKFKMIKGLGRKDVYEFLSDLYPRMQFKPVFLRKCT